MPHGRNPERKAIPARACFAALLLACSPARPQGGQAASGPAQAPGISTGFTDVTAECGAGAVVAAHYRQVPKWWLSGMMLADLDADGDLDLHLAGHGRPAAVAINDGKGSFTYVDPQLALDRGVRHDNDIPYPGGEVRLPADFNEDGLLDLLCAWHDDGGALYLNAWDRRGSPPAARFRRSHDLDVFCRGCALVDIDRDGNADFLYDHGREIAILRGRGDGTFRPAGAIAGSFQQSGFIPVDVNGDGHTDFLMHGRTGGNFYSPTPFERRLLLSDGKGRFTESAAQAGLDKAGGSIHGAGDVDHDGSVDLICVEDGSVAVYLNDGRGVFRRKAGAVKGMESVRGRPRVLAWGGAVVTDLNNDGLADVLICGRYFLYVLRGTGGGEFVWANDEWRVPNIAWSAVDEGLCFGDVSGDGMVDLICCAGGPAGREKGVAVLRNDLPKRNWLRVQLLGRKGNRAAAGAKVRLYSPAAAGEPRRLLWYEQVCIWGRQSFHSYYAAARTERHFGLGRRGIVDVSVEFHPSGRLVERRGVKANATVVIHEQEPGGANRRERP